ncbi:hypothetical protein G6011_01139 [Alternaria panax]|uniref:Uncharacterized protein n=1 Tax=Alternaria panax TaxID=48097 RepID=A0AAD4IKC7_9PLEO|nr:hypothetical protein G6011_01139 [Alternaria panax]
MTTVNPAMAHTTDYDQIKRILEPFHQIFMTVLEDVENPCLPIITLHPAKGDNFCIVAKGRTALPPNIPYDLQTAILKFNQCDLSLVCFLGWIREALRPIGATVEWLLIVSIRPLSILHYSDDEPVIEGGRHSVFAITTASHERYVADFTLEHFGYPTELWFLKKAEYSVRFLAVGARWRIASKEAMEEADRDIAEVDAQQYSRTPIDAVYDEINWPDYRRLPTDERMSWVELHTRDILGRVEEDEDLLNSVLEAAESRGKCS